MRLEDELMSANAQIGFLVLPGLTQLGMTGPLQVLSRVPGAKMSWSLA